MVPLEAHLTEEELVQVDRLGVGAKVDQRAQALVPVAETCPRFDRDIAEAHPRQGASAASCARSVNVRNLSASASLKAR